ncbi:ImmA/IrrE family metallo-endopeptidase [Clostridium sp. AWRP]|uniref:ImmA/IrrE family metallo-endopeptidase n=1 Tax=Clostridium sp. AWRP TaxID=2212991 RepID=UPI000FDC177A|nr:ImmA/IrrE family metallo-endopeptidase [Clostridium sp. AWRP]AZV57941.1 ImmA/IrrE family metallo-endopeptidase [Clostridium sp. AWRP]
MTYDELLKEVQSQGIDVIEMDIGKHKGLYADNIIALSKNIETTKEKACILAEELGHYHKTYGEIIDKKNTSKMKQEKIARNWGYEKLIGIIQLINAFERGIKSKQELAEYLDVTEKFLGQAIQHYREKYGTRYEIDNYIIYFEPTLFIVKIF